MWLKMRIEKQDKHGRPVKITTTVPETQYLRELPLGYDCDVEWAIALRDFLDEALTFYESDFYKWGQRKIQTLEAIDAAK